MDVRHSPEAEAYRAEVRSFLSASLPAGWRGVARLEAGERREFLAVWRAKLYDARLLAPAWPERYGGRGLSRLEQVVLAEEFAKAGVPTRTTIDEHGIDMLGNTLLMHGSEEQKASLLPRILSGELTWAQGFSEPGAGSDLAALSCKARLEGDRWVIDGQKIWTSHGLEANWIFVLARTSDEPSRHAGITMLMVPIDQDGVELRPIRMPTGDAEFCETFFTAATTDAANVVGPVGGGWGVAMDLLGHERGQQAVVAPLRFRAELERLLELARERGVAGDPVVRRRLAWCFERVAIMRWLGLRELTRWLADEPPGVEASIFKLHWSEYHQVATALAIEVLGEDGLVADGPSSGFSWGCESLEMLDAEGAASAGGGLPATWQAALLNSLSATIGAGTSEIQRNVIGERILGLPREPKPALS